MTKNLNPRQLQFHNQCDVKSGQVNYINIDSFCSSFLFSFFCCSGCKFLPDLYVEQLNIKK